MAKKRSSSAARAAKKLHPAIVVLAAVFLAVGIGAGVFASEALSAGDSFTLNGGREVHLSLGEAFDDPGATVLSFGRDISDRVQVGGDADRFDADTPGTYYFVYTVDDLRWGDYQLVRTVIVGGSDPAPETTSATAPAEETVSASETVFAGGRAPASAPAAAGEEA